MAPKKSAEGKSPGPTKKTQDKKPKEKQLKAKLKTPTVIKIRIPTGVSKVNTISTTSSKPTKTPKLTKKQLLEKKALEKFDLANEVAAAQLVKSKPIIEAEPIIKEEPKVPKKRGRKPKVIEEPVTTSADSEDAFEATPVKKKCVRSETKGMKKKSEAVKSTTVKKKLSLSLSPKKTPKSKESPDVNNGANKSSKKIIKKATKTETEAETKTKKNKLNREKGKPKVAVDISQSPSILNVIETLPLESSSVMNIEPCPIDSRKTSLNSELSWTKDISSSSTTTCLTVCSTDFVRIDKKLPVVKLSDIELNKIEQNNNFSSSDEVSNSEPTNSKDIESTPEMETRSLDLSTSSVTPTKSLTPLHNAENSYQHTVINEEINKTSKALDKLTSKLKKFDLEIINWIGYDNEEINMNVKRFQGKIFQVLKEESEVIAHCQRLKKVLSDNVNIDNVNDENSNKNDYVEYVANNVNQKDDHTITEARKEDEYYPIKSPERNFTSERVKYKPFDQSFDDDDALSLYAESITGIDSSHSHTPNNNATITKPTDEEYVPQPVNQSRWEQINKSTYYPTPNLATQAEKPNSDMRSKTICEKQNADSTSIYKDSEQEKCGSAYADKPNPQTPPNNPNINPMNAVKKGPVLMAACYKPPAAMKSNLLRGICFFNLLSSCKNPNCRFPHVVPEEIEISSKLVRLGEEMFIQEYMLLRNWPILRRKYGMCFVQECKRRDLSRILVEMAIDFVMKAKDNIREDAILKVDVLEYVLLHLNCVDLDTCEDLLLYNLYPGVLLCDIFMQTIGNSQNFSRFKPVFMKLTKFMMTHNRTFNLNVAVQILERLAILPCGVALLEALLQIVKHTDRRILENSMMGHFEKQLLVSQDLSRQLMEYKNEVGVCRPASLFELSPRMNPEMEPLMSQSMMPSERERRYTSPDTTNLDNMNKATEDPMIAPTAEFNRARVFGSIQRTFSNSNSSNESEEFRPNISVQNRPNFKNWRDKTIFNHIRGVSPIQRHKSPRHMVGRHVHQMNYGPGLPKFPRRSGPDFY